MDLLVISFFQVVNDARAVLADAADQRMQEDMYGDMTGVMMTNLVSSSPGHQTDVADAKKKREYSLFTSLITQHS